MKRPWKPGSISVTGPPFLGLLGCQEAHKSQLSLHLLDCLIRSTAKHRLCFNYESKLIRNCSHTLFFCAAWLEQDADRKCHKRFKLCCRPKVNNGTWVPLLAIIIFIFSFRNTGRLNSALVVFKSHQLQTCSTVGKSCLSLIDGERRFTAQVSEERSSEMLVRNTGFPHHWFDSIMNLLPPSSRFGISSILCDCFSDDAMAVT